MKSLYMSSLFTLLIIAAHSIFTTAILKAQGPPTLHKTFRGQYDSKLPYPSVEGKLGQRDQAALLEIHESALACSPLEWPGIEATGTFVTGSGKTVRQWSGSLIMEADNRFRLDMKSSAGQISIRSHQWAGKTKRDGGDPQPLPVVQLGEHFMLPSQLWETANQSDVSVIDDGIVDIENVRMHAITIITPIPFRNARSASSFYFDPVTHYLLKSVFTGHYPGDNVHKYQRVISYGDYRTVQDKMVPFNYSESNDDQRSLTFQAQNVTVTTRHDDAFFNF